MDRAAVILVLLYSFFAEGVVVLTARADGNSWLDAWILAASFAWASVFVLAAWAVVV